MATGTDVVLLDPSEFKQNDLAVYRPPDEVLEEARKAAKALQDVIQKKPRPVKFRGEQYLEFEDWQTIGKFYGVTAKVVSTEPVSFGDVAGFLAKAVVVHVPTGREISAAEAMCMKDEDNWKIKPLFQLRSMAQTRACSKALRNVLAWVVVLAGYKPTPAEELPSNEPEDGYAPPSHGNGHTISQQQQTLLQTRMKENGWFLEDGTLAPEAAEYWGKFGYVNASEIPQKDFAGIMIFFSKKRVVKK